MSCRGGVHVGGGEAPPPGAPAGWAAPLPLASPRARLPLCPPSPLARAPWQGALRQVQHTARPRPSPDCSAASSLRASRTWEGRCKLGGRGADRGAELPGDWPRRLEKTSPPSQAKGKESGKRLRNLFHWGGRDGHRKSFPPNPRGRVSTPSFLSVCVLCSLPLFIICNLDTSAPLLPTG